MNGIMNKNQLTIGEEDEYDKSDIHKIASIIDNCIWGCHHKYFHTFDFICVYDIKLSNIGNNEIVIITIADKSMVLYELNKKLENARQNGFMFIQIKKFTKNLNSNFCNLNIHHILK